MARTVSKSQQQVGRKRRIHAKSRKGCGNCKVRRVKCDEAHPHCKRCLSYGVSCSYDENDGVLDLDANGAFRLDFGPKTKPQSSQPSWNVSSVSDFQIRTTSPPKVAPSLSHNQIALSILNDALLRELNTRYGTAASTEIRSWLYTPADLETFHRFQNRTISTIGSAKTQPQMRIHIGSMAFRYPFLMHMLLSLTLLHDADLAVAQPNSNFSGESVTTVTAEQRETEKKYTNRCLRYWTTASTLFNAVLSRPIEPESRDALWAAAAFLGTIAFGYIEPNEVEETWPLTSSSAESKQLLPCVQSPASPSSSDASIPASTSSDEPPTMNSNSIERPWTSPSAPPPDTSTTLDPSLSWLHLSTTKRAIYALSQPHTRPDSIFYTATQDHTQSADGLVAEWIHANDFANIPPEVLRYFDVQVPTQTSESISKARPWSPLSSCLDIELIEKIRHDENKTNGVFPAQPPSPYATPLLILSHLASLGPVTQETQMPFLHFLAYMTPEFKKLIAQKDRRAVMLLGWWLGMLNGGDVWWMRRRAVVMGKSIGAWLEAEGIVGWERILSAQVS